MIVEAIAVSYVKKDKSITRVNVLHLVALRLLIKMRKYSIIL